VAGKNVSLAAEGNNITISATGSGSGGGSCDCPELVEGEGIDIDDLSDGTRLISLEKGSITDEYIKSVSMSKLVQDDEILILNGGKANGYN
jgi:hypothetical protein